MGFKITDGVLMSYIQEEGITSVVIPDGVKRIAFGAFVGCANITSVTMPDSVTSIGGAVFERCSNLETITLSQNIAKIPEMLFDSCKNLKYVTIPNSVTSIEHHAFNCCISLTTITIPENVRRIEYNAFCFCENLTSVIIENNTIEIEQEAFNDCKNLTNLFLRGYQIHGNLGAIKNFTQKLNDAILMLDNKDFSVKLEKELKFPFILAYYRKTKDETAFTYIKKNFLKIVTYLIDQNDIEMVTAIVNSGKFLTKRNIDKMIDYAIEKERHEIYILLLNYKAEKLGFKDIANQFRL